MISPCILVICIELRWRQLCSDPLEWSKETLCPGVDTHNTQVAGFGAFFKTPPTVEPVDENLLPRGGHTHRAVFGAVKVVVRPGASSSVLTPRGTFVQKAPNCWRNEELVDT